MKEQKILKSDRLILRPFRIEDAAAVQLLAGEKEISETTLNIPYPYEDGLAENWIKEHSKKFTDFQEIVYAITLKKNKRLIGAIGLILNHQFNNAEMGYWVGKSYWNKGYATEAVAAVLEFAFKDLKLNKVHAHHFTTNPSSGKVMIKNNMIEEGLLKEHVVKNGKYMDIRQYGILRREYSTKNND